MREEMSGRGVMGNERREQRWGRGQGCCGGGQVNRETSERRTDNHAVSAPKSKSLRSRQHATRSVLM